MEAKVVKPFKDLPTGEIFLVGSVYSGEEKRIDELAGKGFVEKPAPKAPAKKPAKK